jgi:hypothetical protein
MANAINILSARKHFQLGITHLDPFVSSGQMPFMLWCQQCKDDRDRIYASSFAVGASALTPDKPFLRPNYHQPVTHVYTEFAKHYLKLGSIGFLIHAGLCHRKEFKVGKDKSQSSAGIYLPSWAPEHRVCLKNDWRPSFGDARFEVASNFLMNASIAPDDDDMIFIQGFHGW